MTSQGREYIIMNASRLPAGGIASHTDAYTGPSCTAAGVEPGKVYEALDVAQTDKTLLDAQNPVGFRIWQIGQAYPIEP